MLAACVPGAFGGWLLLLREFGTWRLEDVLEFAIGYAEQRLPAPRADPRDDRAHRGAPRDLAGVARPLPPGRPRPARSSGTRRSRRRTGASSRRAAAARARRRSSARGPRSTRASSPRRSTASPPPRAGCSPGRPGRLGSDARAAVVTLRLPRAHRVQDAARGPRGRSGCSSSRCSRASTSPSSPRPSSCTSSPSARSSRSPIATPSTATPTCALDILLSDEYTTSAARSSARMRRRSTGPGSAGCRVSTTAVATPRLGRAGPRHGAPRRRRSLRERDLRDAERRLAQSSPVIPALGWPLGTRAQMFWLEEGLPSSLRPGDAAADDALPRPRAARRASRTSRGERRAATSRSSGRCTRSCATSTSASTCRRRSTRRSSTPTTSSRRSTRAGSSRKSLALESRFGLAHGRRAPAARARRHAVAARGRSAA